MKLEIRDFSAKLNSASGAEVLFSNVNFEIETGIVGLCGPSGVGKSTFLLSIVGLVNEQSSLKFAGTVHLDGESSKDISPRILRKMVCLLPQHPVVFPGSILQNAILGAESHGLLSKKNHLVRCEELLMQVGLWNEVKYKLQDPAHTLSLGQKQRLCLARALGVEPQFLLLDEPTASLDAFSQARVEETLLNFSKTKGVILVTHNTDQRNRLCNKCVELQRGGECVISDVIQESTSCLALENLSLEVCCER